MEIGSWCGRSMVALGMAARFVAGRKVHCVDAFPERADWRENPDGSFSYVVDTAEGPFLGHATQSVWREPFEREVLPVYERWGSPRQAFLTFRERFGLADVVLPHRMGSAAFFEGPGREHRYGLTFIDGEHSYAAVAHDIEACCARLVSGGILCLDDAFTCYEGVDRAIEDRLAADPALVKPVRITRKMFAAVRA
jgi:Methyltransferase domain